MNLNAVAKSSFALLILFVSSSPLFAGTVSVGAISSGNCIPFSCTFGGTQYQQVYSASAFGPSGLDINEISFSATLNGGDVLAGGTFIISLSTTASGVNNLNPNFSANIGGDHTVVFDGSLPALSDDRTLNFMLSSDFNYDPSLGNLLLNVVAVDQTPGLVSLDDGTSNSTSRIVQSSGADSSGLATTFSGIGLGVVIVSDVPEPSTWVMLVLGFCGIAAAWRRKQRYAALLIPTGSLSFDAGAMSRFNR